MSDDDRPANTEMFRAFVDRAEDDARTEHTTRRRAPMILVGVVALAVVIVAIVLATMA